MGVDENLRILICRLRGGSSLNHVLICYLNGEFVLAKDILSRIPQPTQDSHYVRQSLMDLLEKYSKE